MSSRGATNTGTKDAKGRTIWKGPRDGLFVLSSTGKKTVPAKGPTVRKKAPAPAPGERRRGGLIDMYTPSGNRIKPVAANIMKALDEDFKRLFKQRLTKNMIKYAERHGWEPVDVDGPGKVLYKDITWQSKPYELEIHYYVDDDELNDESEHWGPKYLAQLSVRGDEGEVVFKFLTGGHHYDDDLPGVYSKLKNNPEVKKAYAIYGTTMGTPTDERTMRRR